MTFYQLLRDLDHQIVGDGLCAIPTGRAYKGAQGPYADKIHILPFGEKTGDLDLSRIPDRNERPNIYMGTAGLINLPHLCKIKPTHAILFDVNPFQTLYWNVVVSLIRANLSYSNFKVALNFGEAITRRVIEIRLQDIDFSSSGSWTEILQSDDGLSLSRKAFMANSISPSAYLDMAGLGEEDYAFLKNMVDHGCLGTLTLDVFDADSWEHLSEFLKQAHAKDKGIPAFVDTLYVSSVFRFTGIDSDWTGRKLKELSARCLSSVLNEDKSIVLDHQNVYTVPDFQSKMTRGQKWPYQLATSKESAAEFGADKLVPRSI